MHTCPMQTPAVVPIPHVGGPILPPGCPTVLIGGMPAVRMGDMCTCVGPPDAVVKGSAGVLIGGAPAARMGDNMAHGGVIAMGCPTVLIGEAGGGGGGGGGGGTPGAAAGPGVASAPAPTNPGPAKYAFQTASQNGTACVCKGGCTACSQL